MSRLLDRRALKSIRLGLPGSSVAASVLAAVEPLCRLCAPCHSRAARRRTSSIARRVGLVLCVGLGLVGLVGCAHNATSPPAVASTAMVASQVATNSPLSLERSSDALVLLLPSMRTFFGIDFQSLASSSAMKPARTFFRESWPTAFEQLEQLCNFELPSDLSWLVAGQRADGSGAVVIVSGAFTEKTAERCLVSLQDDGAARGPAVAISSDGEYRVYKMASRSVHAYWATDSVVMLSASADLGSLEMAVARLDEASPKPTRPELVQDVDMTAVGWMVSQSGYAFEPPFDSLRVIHLAIKSAQLVHIDLAGDFESSADASQAHNFVLTLMPHLQSHPMAADFHSIIDKVNVSVAERRLSGEVFLDGAEVEKIVNFTRAFGLF